MSELNVLSRHPFDLLMELDTSDIRLDCASLHVARDAHPDVDLPHYLRVLDSLAEQVGALRPGLSAPLRYQALQHVLVEQEDLCGNSDDYYDPDNSYLNCVLENHAGSPIALSIVWMEVGRRLKWPVAGIAFPGHYLVRVDDAERFLVVDPFRDGRSLSLEDCRELLQESAGQEAEFSLAMLEPVDTRQTLIRLLNNLRLIYLAQHDWERLGSVVRRLHAAEPANSQHVKDLAALHCREGDLQLAQARLAAYLRSRPQAVPELRAELRRIAAAVAALN
jgi:regulator of sirC expression with transglutaminase-like and TPR domain